MCPGPVDINFDQVEAGASLSGIGHRPKSEVSQDMVDDHREESMKHHSPQEIAASAAVYSTPVRPAMSRRERLERWADILERHGGPLNALRRIEYLSPQERRAYQGLNTPLTIAFSDPVLRDEGLRSERLGDVMDFFELSEGETHQLLCDCRYYGSMTGSEVARRMRIHAERKEFRTGLKRAIARFFGFAR